MKGLKTLTLMFLMAFTVCSVYGHFQLIYTPASVIEESVKQVDFKLVFTHPFDAGHTMDIGKNKAGEVKGLERFFIVHKGKKTDALPGLKKTTFASLENSGVAYDFSFDKQYGLSGSGDWVLVALPFPYYEGAEDVYIQQVTKVMINKSGIATDWSERCAEGFPEILPLVKPYDVWAGGLFRGTVVDPEGKPVPFAEIEVEYMNYDVDMKAGKFSGEKKIKKEGHGAAVILADGQGVFEFIPPKAGYWGFAALGAGGEKTFDGKELSQDAVLWIQANSIQEGSGGGGKEKTAAPAAEKKAGSSMILVIAIAALVVIVAAIFVMKRKKGAA